MGIWYLHCIIIALLILHCIKLSKTLHTSYSGSGSTVLFFLIQTEAHDLRRNLTNSVMLLRIIILLHINTTRQCSKFAVSWQYFTYIVQLQAPTIKLAALNSILFFSVISLGNHNVFVFIWKLCSCSLKTTSYIFFHFNLK